jgi:uncharacterized membrane protein
MGIFPVLLLGLVLRLLSINQSLWLDEATSAVLARDFSFVEILTKFSPGDFHPPLYYLILRSWAMVFGTSAIALRSLSILAGLGGIYILYPIVRELFNNRVAPVSSLLLATSGLHIYFSQEVRMYQLASFFVLLAIYYFVKTEKDNRVGDWQRLSIFTALSGMTHYMTIFIVPVFWIYGILNKKKKSWFKKLLTSHIILFVFGLLWSPTFLNQLSVGFQAKILSPVWWTTLGKSNFKDALLVPVKFTIGRVTWDNKYLYGLIVVTLLSFFGLLIYDAYKKWHKEKHFWFVVLWLSVPFLVALLLGFWFSVFGYFRLLFLLPAFYVLIALGIDSLKVNLFKFILGLTMAINLLLSVYYLIDTKFHREDWRGLVSYINQSNYLNRGIVIFVTYNQREAFRYYDTDRKIRINGPAYIYEGYDIIWLMRYAQPIFDPNDKVRKDIESLGYSKIGEHDFNGVTVWKYIK